MVLCCFLALFGFYASLCSLSVLIYLCLEFMWQEIQHYRPELKGKTWKVEKKAAPAAAPH